MNNKPLNFIKDSEYDPFYTFIFDVAPSVIDVDKWECANKLVDVNERETSIKITASLNDKNYSFDIFFPDCGGIRICGEKKGYWNPQSNLIISRYRFRANEYLLPDGVRVKLCFKDGWKISVINKNRDNVLNITQDNILFGFIGDEIKKIKLILPLEKDEKIFGLGERFGGINMRGKRTVLWNTDCGYHGSKGNAELWRSYKNVPFFHTTSGYSCFYNSYRSALCDIGLSERDKFSFEFSDSSLDMYIWALSPLENISAYTELTGKPFLPPKWAFGYMAGGGNGFWNTYPDSQMSGPEKRLAVLDDVIKGYCDLGTPDVDSVYGEGEISYQDEAYEKLSVHGTRMMNWNPPDYEKDFMKEYLPTVEEKDLPRTKDVNNPMEDCRNFIDFFNPNAKQLLINRYKKYWTMGLRGGMIDFAELVPENALFSNGMTGEDMHNFFPYWYGKTYGDACREVIGEDFIFYCRGGCAGSQHTSANFSGDQAATFEGLRHQLSAGLTMGCTGFSAWGADLGGYEMKPSSEVFARGVQFSTFQPLMRAHGTMTRCPWDFDENAQNTYKEHYWLRENLFYMLYSNAIDASKTGMPMMRALILEYFGDKRLQNVEDEYIFCKNLLVAPVMTENAKERAVDFPKGNWFDLFEGEKTVGGKTVNVPVTPSRSPVYVKAGSVILLSLSDDYILGASMLDKERKKVLLITPPDTDSIEIQWDSIGEKTQYIINKNEKAFDLNISGNKNFSAALIYGKPPKSVLVDGDCCKLRTVKPNVTLVEFNTNVRNMINVIY